MPNPAKAAASAESLLVVVVRELTSTTHERPFVSNFQSGVGVTGLADTMMWDRSSAGFFGRPCLFK